MPIDILFLRFKSYYHVGWRHVERIIDGTTVIRAIASTAFMLGAHNLINSIKAGNIACSAILPSVKDKEGHHRLLTLFPPLPSTIRISKLNVEWITLRALYKLITECTRCVNNGGIPFVEGKTNDGKSLKITCHTAYNEYRDLIELPILMRCKDKKPVTIVDIYEGCVLEDVVFNDVINYRNRIDRVSSSADPFFINGIKAYNTLWLCLKGPEKDLNLIKNAIFNVLKDLGVGAYRSRGWGKFSLEHVDPHPDDMNVLRKHCSWKRNSYVALLASMLINGEIDTKKSFVRIFKMEGKSGPNYAEYDLPSINSAGVGSLIYLVKDVGPKIVNLRQHIEGFNPFIVFNPIVISGRENEERA